MQSLKVRKETLKIRKIILICTVIFIIMIPLISASAMLNHSVNSSSATNGLQLMRGTQNENGITDFNNESNVTVENLISYLNENELNIKNFIVTSLAETANKIILSTSKAFKAVGGISGTNRVLSLAKFRETLKKKEIKLKNEWDTFIILKDFSKMKSPLKL